MVAGSTVNKPGLEFPVVRCPRVQLCPALLARVPATLPRALVLPVSEVGSATFLGTFRPDRSLKQRTFTMSRGGMIARGRRSVFPLNFDRPASLLSILRGIEHSGSDVAALVRLKSVLETESAGSWGAVSSRFPERRAHGERGTGRYVPNSVDRFPKTGA
jgi:hypothetical protein